jgi:phage tail protein X
MTTEIEAEQEFYKTYYFNHSVCIDGQWYHGTTAAELEATVEANEGKGAFDRFLKAGGEVEYPIYGVPVASGSTWVEDAKSPEDGVKRVKELQDEADKLYKGYFDEIKTRLAAKREDLWGPGVLSWPKGNLDRLIGDVALSVAVEMKGTTTSAEQEKQIGEFAAEILFHQLQKKLPDDDEIPGISKLATLSARANGNDISADVETYVTDEIVKRALSQAQVSLDDIVPLTAYLKAFDRHAYIDFMNNEFRNEHEDTLVKDFVSLKENGLTGMALVEAAQKECDRLASKYGLERYPAGNWGTNGR